MAAGNTYTQIASTTLGSAAASVTFSSIAGTYTDLVLVTQVKGTSSSDQDLTAVFNSDTNTNYSRTILYGNGSVAGSVRASNETSWKYATVPGTTTNQWEIATLQLFNYYNATTYKTGLIRRNQAGEATAANVVLWRKAPDAITNIVLAPAAGSFATGSTFNLYGITAA